MKSKRLAWNKVLRGIQHESKAFSGPYTAQIDLTDKCNNTCIACWVHSPLLNEKKIFPQGHQELDFKSVKQLVSQLYKLGTRKIILSGSGEPLLYPYIEEVIKIIKLKGMHLNIITNALLLNEKIAKLVVRCKVDLITVSVWAGSAEAYVNTHPGKTHKDFDRIKNNLIRVSRYKIQYKTLIPHIKLYNVICNCNYNDINNMVDFAKVVDADSTEFQIVDILKGSTDKLSLTGDNAGSIIKSLQVLRSRNDLVAFDAPLNSKMDDFTKNEFLDFGKIWKNSKKGFRLNQYCKSLTCRKNLNIDSKRIVISESTGHHTENAVFRYMFENKTCFSCSDKLICLSDKKGIEISLLNILGIGSFLRRLQFGEHEQGVYEKQIDTIPCYIGWYYTRILTDGSVIPCCKAVKLPLGNIYNNTFDSIWHSKEYEKFRFNAKNLTKFDNYFSKINCAKSCDNWGMIVEIHQSVIKNRENNKIWKNKFKKNTEYTTFIKAKDFYNGNLNTSGKHSFGNDIVIHGGFDNTFAEYNFNINKEGQYYLYTKYASNSYRPVDIYVDNELVKHDALSGLTGGWTCAYLNWFKEADVYLKKGTHSLKIESSNVTPHMEQFALSDSWRPMFLAKNKTISIKSALIQKDILKERVGFLATKFKQNINLSYLKSRYLEILGIYDGSHGYKGPFHVQVDLTNKCNNSCIACWCNSPLFKKSRLTEEEKSQFLPRGMVYDLLDEITFMGATEVYFSGSGEPFMHPDIMEILAYAKSKGLICHVNTNFTLMDKQKMDKLIEIGVDFLTVSTWAATSKTYVATHLNKTEKDFDKLIQNLVYLNSNKNSKPKIKLYNVIFNMNYFELESMVEFAEQTKSESLEFTLVDTIPKITDVLALNEKQLSELRNACNSLNSQLDQRGVKRDTGILVFQFDQFLRRISVSDDVKQAQYDRNIIDSMPCYIGWLFARIIPNGEVHSCLKAHRMPTGSLYQNKFSEIWNSDKQKYFRKKTLICKKADPFFRLIGNDPATKEAGCYKSCDDIGRNTWMNNKMKRLTLPEKSIIKVISSVLKMIRAKKNIINKKKQECVILGIKHGRHAFTGPEHVVVDITNKCNLQCLSCWLHSPLLSKSVLSKDLLRQELPKETLFTLIDDLSSMHTKRIRLTGGGEPFAHKDIFSVIEYARSKNIDVSVTTNLSLISTDDIKRLIDVGIDELCISLWASNADVYARVHPGASSEIFSKIINNLSYLSQIKTSRPRVTIANVIMNKNVQDFRNMYNMGVKYNVDALYFTLVDVIERQTDSLLLNLGERRMLLQEAIDIKEKNEDDKICLEFFDGLLNRLKSSAKSFAKGHYDTMSVNSMPCYVGWFFARILADGSVAPCCRGVKKIMGNINENTFKNIWFSDLYNEFRSKARYLNKHDYYFEKIGCLKECDNLMHNQDIYKRLTEIE